MSIYSTGVDAYRDTTKWLTAFVPIVSLVTAIAVIGPRLVRTVQTSPSVTDWLADYWLSAVCGTVLIISIAAILTTGARVLSIEPQDISDLATDGDGANSLANAIGSGVTLPEFFDKGEFDKAMIGYQVAAMKGQVSADDPGVARLRFAVEALREWSVFARIQEPFRRFRITFVISAATIVLAVVLAPLQLGSSAAIDKPTKVEVELNSAAADDLEAKTGCSLPDESTFWATGGTWDHPELTADGPNCRFGTYWYPDRDDIELLEAAAASEK